MDGLDICKECGGRITRDEGHGEFVCTKCGLITEKDFPDIQNRRNFLKDQEAGLLPESLASSAGKMGKHGAAYSLLLRTHKERTQYHVRKNFESICEKLRIPKHSIRFNEFFDYISKKKWIVGSGRNLEDVTISLFYMYLWLEFDKASKREQKSFLNNSDSMNKWTRSRNFLFNLILRFENHYQNKMDKIEKDLEYFLSKFVFDFNSKNNYELFSYINVKMDPSMSRIYRYQSLDEFLEKFSDLFEFVSFLYPQTKKKMKRLPGIELCRDYQKELKKDVELFKRSYTRTIFISGDSHFHNFIMSKKDRKKREGLFFACCYIESCKKFLKEFNEFFRFDVMFPKKLEKWAKFIGVSERTLLKRIKELEEQEGSIRKKIGSIEKKFPKLLEGKL